VRQTTDQTATITLAWTFSPDGGVVLGEEGPVTHLGCENDAVYDWSTGLIFKNGRYFDPELGIWLLGPLMVVFGLWRPRRRRKGRKGAHRNYFFTLLIVLFVMVMPLTGCDPPEPEIPPTETCTPTPVPGQPSQTPPPSVPTETPTSTPESPDTSIPPTGTPPPTNTPPSTETPTRTPHPYKLLPSTKPSEVTGVGNIAWQGLLNIQHKEGFWSNNLDEREALILIINHELEYQVQYQPPKDVIINQYNNWCGGNTWSADCINDFWGYSHVIRENKVCCNGSERIPPTDQFVKSLSNNILAGTAVAQDPSLMHYGNALNDRSAQLLPSVPI
jgi:hypothetical protein